MLPVAWAISVSGARRSPTFKGKRNGGALRIFLDRTVPPAKSDRVREVIADALIPQLRTHPQFARLAVLVSSDPRRGGWQVAVVVLDPDLTPVGDAEIPLDPVELDRLTTALRQL